MIHILPSWELARLCLLPEPIALRYLDRINQPHHGNAQIIPFRTRRKRTMPASNFRPDGGAA